MFKMRIINLVNISTVLLLINLLQTKSRLVGNENGFMLTVSIYGAQLSDKVTSVPVTWMVITKIQKSQPSRNLLLIPVIHLVNT
uniref:Egg protein CP3842 n=1 Tax=Schistosoma japonicum TaxID=6182 RepID=C1LXQ9_SCHJA|nr:Egg protein CP3842 [Schistosoma japonicum]